MSIIGPKPVSVQDMGAYKTFDQRRFAVRPGFFLLISDHPRQENSIPRLEEDIRRELNYIVTWNLLSDCKILIKLIKKYMLCLVGHEAKRSENHDY